MSKDDVTPMEKRVTRLKEEDLGSRDISKYFPVKPRAQELAEQHVDWFLGAIRKPMIDEFIHGYKHGVEDTLARIKEEQK